MEEKGGRKKQNKGGAAGAAGEVVDLAGMDVDGDSSSSSSSSSSGAEDDDSDWSPEGEESDNSDGDESEAVLTPKDQVNKSKENSSQGEKKRKSRSQKRNGKGGPKKRKRVGAAGAAGAAREVGDLTGMDVDGDSSSSSSAESDSSDGGESEEAWTAQKWVNEYISTGRLVWTDLVVLQLADAANGCPIDTTRVHLTFDRLNSMVYPHFRDRDRKVLFMNGGLTSQAEHGPPSLHTYSEVLRVVHKWVMGLLQPLISRGVLRVVRIKGIRHGNRLSRFPGEGTEEEPITVNAQPASDDDYIRYFLKENHTSVHQDYMYVLQNGTTVVGPNGRTCTFDRDGNMQQRARNGSIIINLGGERTFQFTFIRDCGPFKMGDVRCVVLGHGDIIAFGPIVNSVCTHEVLKGGMGRRLSLVYEVAVHPKTFQDSCADLLAFSELLRGEPNLNWRDTLMSDLDRKA